MRLELVWRVPWDATWNQGQKERAAEKLVSYMREGTFYEAGSRMRLASAEAVVVSNTEGPAIHLTLEN